MAILELDNASLYYTDPDIEVPKISIMDLEEGRQLVAREVPDCTHRVLAGRGHMLALENPQQLGD